MSIDLFSDAFHVPCKFVHDAECACTSELWENPDITNATYISLGYHLGGASLSTVSCLPEQPEKVVLLNI